MYSWVIKNIHSPEWTHWMLTHVPLIWICLTKKCAFVSWLVLTYSNLPVPHLWKSWSLPSNHFPAQQWCLTGADNWMLYLSIAASDRGGKMNSQRDFSITGNVCAQSQNLDLQQFVTSHLSADIPNVILPTHYSRSLSVSKYLLAMRDAGLQRCCIGKAFIPFGENPPFWILSWDFSSWTSGKANCAHNSSSAWVNVLWNRLLLQNFGWYQSMLKIRQQVIWSSDTNSWWTKLRIAVLNPSRAMSCS